MLPINSGSSTLLASPLITFKFLGCPNFEDSVSANCPSISIATTFLTLLVNSFVRTPCPGPISNTVSLVVNSALSAIAISTSWSIKKCCPSDFRGILFIRNPS